MKLPLPDAPPFIDSSAPGTWNVLSSGVTTQLRAVWGSGPYDVYVAGVGGVLLHSVDRGVTFAPVTLPTFDAGVANFACVWGSGPSDVYVGGGQTMLHFDGVSWTQQPSQAYAAAVWGSGSSDVFAEAGYGDVRHSTGAGADWVYDSFLPEAEPGGAIWGASAKDVYFVVNGDIVHHAGAFTAYTPQSILGSSYLRGVWGSSTTEIYAVGDVIARTGDSGLTYQTQVNPTGMQLYWIWGSSATDVYAVGQGITVIHTVNHGKTWVAEEAGATTTSLYGVWGSGANDIYAVGDNGLIIHR